MKKTLCILLTFCMLFTFSSCKNKSDTISSVDTVSGSSSSSIPNNTKDTESDSDSNTVKTNVKKSKIDPSYYEKDYFGVPVKLKNTYVKVNAIKLLNYYFIDVDAVQKIYGIKFSINESVSVNTKNMYPENIFKIEKGTINPGEIQSDKTSVINDDKALIVKYENKNYISIKSLNDYIKEKLYVNPDTAEITDSKITFKELPETNNSLLRKRVIIDSEHDMTVKDSTVGKILVVGDVFGTNLNIEPNDETSYSKGYQNIFLHKTSNNTVYMFGTLSNSIEVFKITVNKDLSFNIKGIGFIQRTAQNIYYINKKYIAVGKNFAFVINVNKDDVSDSTIKNLPVIKETSGQFNIINNNYYLVSKDSVNSNNIIEVLKFDPKNISFSKIYKFNSGHTYNTISNNFMYSHVEQNKIGIYAMADDKYIYHLVYDPKTKKSSNKETNKFRLFYCDTPYVVDMYLDLVYQNNSGNSTLNLNIDGNFLGTNILVYGVEDNWVYCSKYENSALKAFRYNRSTGVYDYTNYIATQSNNTSSSSSSNKKS